MICLNKPQGSVIHENTLQIEKRNTSVSDDVTPGNIINNIQLWSYVWSDHGVSEVSTCDGFL